MRFRFLLLEFLWRVLIGLLGIFVVSWLKPERRELKWFVVLASAIAISIAWWVSRPVPVNVPALVNLTSDAAKDRCEQSDLKPVEQPGDYSEPAGKVYHQDPNPGDAWRQGTLIRFFVYRGNPVDKLIIRPMDLETNAIAWAKSFVTGSVGALVVVAVSFWLVRRFASARVFVATYVGYPGLASYKGPLIPRLLISPSKFEAWHRVFKPWRLGPVPQWVRPLAWIILFVVLVVVATNCAHRLYFACGEVPTPVLEGLTREDAERSLEREKLVPAVRLRDVGKNIDEVNHVLRFPAQSPPPGWLLPPNTVVEFSVGIRGQAHLSSGNEEAIMEPLPARIDLDCGRALDGPLECPISGKARGIDLGRHLLFWLQPNLPPANPSGWYLAAGSEYSIDAGKSEWAGIVRFGGRLYLPEDGETVWLAVTIVDEQGYRYYMSRAGQAWLPPDPPLGLTAPARTLATIRRETR